MCSVFSSEAIQGALDTADLLCYCLFIQGDDLFELIGLGDSSLSRSVCASVLIRDFGWDVVTLAGKLSRCVQTNISIIDAQTCDLKDSL